MSELKTYKMVDEKYCTDCVCVIPSEVYLKYEADKVIAELKNENERLKKEASCTFSDDCLRVRQLRADYKEACDRLHTANLIKDEQLAATRHSKRKRCLAMARWCKDNADWWDYEQINRLHEQRGNAESFRFKAAHNRFCFFVKWNERWLELADKFKE